MATVVKDFKVKSGLVVEGTTGTINNFDILTKKQADQDYIVSLIGGTATPTNTPDTVVKRDANGDFAAGTVTVNSRLNIGSIGYIEDDADDLLIANTDGNDVVLQGEDIRLNAQDDVRLNAGTNGDVVLTSNTGTIRLEGPSIYAGESLTYVDSEKVATRGYVDDAIDAIDLTFTTDDVTEGTNRYFTEERIDDHISGSYPIEYDAGVISLAVATNGGLVTDEGGLYIQRSVVDGWYDANGAAAAAQTAAQNYADGLAVNYDVAGAAAAAQTAAEGFATQAVADLVNGAPAVLDTLAELATALENNPDIIADLQDVAAGKQDTLTAGANIDIAGDTISVTGLDTDDVAEGTNLYFTDARALTATASAYDASGSASAAQANAEDYTDSAISTEVSDRNSAISDAISTEVTDRNNAITDAVNALTTDDIEEGMLNEYFTNQKAQMAAGVLLTKPETNLTNIQITTNANGGLDIVAENGVAESDTDDLDEGSTNFYFTEQRAVDALQGTDSMFSTVSIDEVALQVAASLSAPTAGVQTAYAWDKSDYRSAEFLVKVAYSTHTEISKVLLTLDTSDNIAITEYGIVGTNGSASTISAGISGTDVQLLVTTANINSTVTVVGTLLA